MSPLNFEEQAVSAKDLEKLERELAAVTKERDAIRLCFAEASHNAGPAFVAHAELAKCRTDLETTTKERTASCLASFTFGQSILDRMKELEDGVEKIRFISALHYIGQAFDPGHMRAICNFCIGLQSNEGNPTDIDDAPPPIAITELRDRIKETESERDALERVIASDINNGSALRKENAQLRDRIKELELKAADRNEWQDVAMKLRADLDKALAENKRLREALEDISHGNFPSELIKRCAEKGDVMEMKDWLQHCARKAIFKEQA